MDIQVCAKDITRHHQHLYAGESTLIESLLHELPPNASPIFSSAWLGVRMLGFVPQDADCIARAWHEHNARAVKSPQLAVELAVCATGFT